MASRSLDISRSYQEQSYVMLLVVYMPNPFKRFVYEFSYSFCAHKDIFVKAGYSYVKINDH